MKRSNRKRHRPEEVERWSVGARLMKRLWRRDDVSVTLVPAPGALALLGAAGLVGARRRR